MPKNSFTFHAARRSSQSGFTLVELLVVIGIIAILAGVALGPITRGLENAKESAGMQTARTIALSEFQYSIDNQTYPGGAKSQDIAIALVQGQYISDPSIFAASKPVAYTGPISAISGMQANNICWDFIAVIGSSGGANVGLSTSDPDGMPAVFSTGQNVAIPSQGPGGVINVNVNNKNPFGSNGMAVCYKSNSAQFLKADNVGGTPQVNTKPANYLFNASFTASPGNYVQLKPE